MHSLTPQPTPPAGTVPDLAGPARPIATGAGSKYRYDPWRDFARLLKLGRPGADGLVELSLGGGRARLPRPAHGVSRPDDARPAGTGAARGRGRS